MMRPVLQKSPLARGNANRLASRAGFSMVEMMTVLVIFGLVLAAAIPNVTSYMRRDRVRVAAQEFRSRCMVAHERAVSTRLPHRITYSPSSSSYYLERRVNGVWVPASADTTQLPGGLSLDGGTAADPSHHEITFEPVGTVAIDDVPATVTFYNGTNDSSSVTLVRTGRMTLRHN